MKLLYSKKAQRYIIATETKIARIYGIVYFTNIEEILYDFKGCEQWQVCWEPKNDYYLREEDEVIIGEFNSVQEIDDVFAEYLI